jgi:trimethylamine--corrinoid protein Co-methyltransferase
MTETSQLPGTHRRGGGRIGRKALRSAAVPSFPTLVRKIPAYEIVPDEAVELIHQDRWPFLKR